MNANAVVREGEHELITLRQASELYGIPRTFLLRWKREGGLNNLNGLVSRGGRLMVDRTMIEKMTHLVPLKRPKAPKAHRNGVGHLN